jgi:hypothetical protein
MFCFETCWVLLLSLYVFYWIGEVVKSVKSNGRDLIAPYPVKKGSVITETDAAQQRGTICHKLPKYVTYQGDVIMSVDIRTWISYICSNT